MCPVRELVAVLLVTVNDTEPGPVPLNPAMIVIQFTSVEADQPQDTVVLTATELLLLPAGGIDSEL